MNTAWFAQNKLFTAFFAVVLAGVAGLGWLTFQAGARNAEVSQRYDAQVRELQRLSSLPLYPSKENEARLAEQNEAYRVALEDLHNRMAKRAESVEPISPTEFKARLTRERDAFREKAREANVAIPENFFLGFEAYQDIVPPDDATATLLARQLNAILGVLGVLADAGIREIRGVARTPVPGEAGAPVTTAPRAEAAQPRRPERRPARGDERRAPQPLIERYPFTVNFVGGQSRLRDALNAIPKLPFFLVVRSLNLDNTDPTPPPRTPPGAEGSGRMEFIVGTEEIEAGILIELLAFNPLNLQPAQEN